MTLSKSQYIRGLQCHKSLWLYKNKPELREAPDSQSESNFNTGYQVGDLAKELFPNGVEIEFDSNNFNAMIEKTKEYLTKRDLIGNFKKRSVERLDQIKNKLENLYKELVKYQESTLVEIGDLAIFEDKEILKEKYNTITCFGVLVAKNLELLRQLH